MTEELTKLTTWFNAKKLSLKAEKTHYLIFRPGQKLLNPSEKLYIHNKIITRDETTPFLGVKLVSKLSSGPNIQYIKSKISKSIGIISKARRCLN